MERELEAIFSHAVALDQGGRMRNTIFCGGQTVYILNFDKTVLLRFHLSSTNKTFDQPVAFNANDYDSSKFYEKDGRIIFEKSGAGFDRKKSCAVPGKTYSEVESLFSRYTVSPTCHSFIELNKKILELLSEDLSHIEIHTENRKPVITQRDIYSGTVTRLTRQPQSGLRLTAVPDTISEDIGPVGLRTNDLAALFNFNENIRLGFSSDAGYCTVQGMNSTMAGIIAFCLYDELGTIQEVPIDGGQIKEKRASVTGVNRSSCKTRSKV